MRTSPHVGPLRAGAVIHSFLCPRNCGSARPEQVPSTGLLKDAAQPLVGRQGFVPLGVKFCHSEHRAVPGSQPSPGESEQGDALSRALCAFAAEEEKL